LHDGQTDEFQKLSWSKRKIVKKFELSKVIIAKKNQIQTQSDSNTIRFKHNLGQTKLTLYPTS